MQELPRDFVADERDLMAPVLRYIYSLAIEPWRCRYSICDNPVSITILNPFVTQCDNAANGLFGFH